MSQPNNMEVVNSLWRWGPSCSITLMIGKHCTATDYPLIVITSQSEHKAAVSLYFQLRISTKIIFIIWNFDKEKHLQFLQLWKRGKQISLCKLLGDLGSSEVLVEGKKPSSLLLFGKCPEDRANVVNISCVQLKRLHKSSNRHRFIHLVDYAKIENPHTEKF